MKKELRFSSKIDTAEFDRSVEQMQRKLREIYSGSDSQRALMETRQRVSQAGLGSAVTPQEKAKVDADERRHRQELEKFIRQQSREQEKLNKELTTQVAQMRALRKEQEAMIKLGREDVEIKEKINRLSQSASQTRAQIAATSSATNQALDQRQQLINAQPQGWQRVARGYQMGGLGGAARALIRQPGLMAGAASGLLGGVGGALGIGGMLYGQYAEMPGQIAQAEGTAATAAAQPGLAFIRGQGLQESLFAPERARAAQQAQDTQAARRRAANMRAAGGVAGILGAGVTGAAGGAALGAGFFGIGAIPGAIIGGIGGAATAAYGMSGSANMTRLLGGRYSEAFEAQMAAEQAGFGQNFFEDLQRRDPMKKEYIDRLSGNAQRDLQLQRALGLSDADLRGGTGLLQRGASQGFTIDQTERAAMQVMQAGGGTRAAINSSTFANRMARDRDLTNAPQILGMLGGTLQDQSQDSATVKILAEGVRLGLNGSEFVEENRRFAQIAAQAIAGAGARDEGAATRIGATFAGFVGDRGTQGLQAAQTGYQAFQAVTAQRGGSVGALQAAAMQSDPVLSRLGRASRSMAVGMSVEQIQAGGAAIEAMAAEAGVDVGELQQSLVSAKMSSVAPTRRADELRDQLRSMARGRSPTEAMRDPAFRRTLGTYQTELAQYTQMPQGTRAQESFALGNVFGEQMAAGEAAEAMAVAPGERRIADIQSAQTAGGELAFLRETVGGLGGAIDKAKADVQSFGEAVLQVAKSIADQRKILESGVTQSTVTQAQRRAVTQPQALPPRR
jgi:hypothetical protein